jgi:hypothetical protein
MCTAGIAIGLIALGLGMFALAGALYAIRETDSVAKLAEHSYKALNDWGRHANQSVTKSDNRRDQGGGGGGYTFQKDADCRDHN